MLKKSSKISLELKSIGKKIRKKKWKKEQNIFLEEKEKNIKKGRCNGSRRRYCENIEIGYTRLIIYSLCYQVVNPKKLRIKIANDEYDTIRNEFKLSSSIGAPNSN